ncbi:unnamed protein product [Larinioides sclopetarius]|uniref:Uncharacterized protein n=1 Tax=Larinioides sclopetarius TaxID=280406 RepID=A0AAV2BEW5_9ARAC
MFYSCLERNFRKRANVFCSKILLFHACYKDDDRFRNLHSCPKMKSLFLITSLLLIVAIFGEVYKMEDEILECFFKLMCELNKFDEFYEIREVAGTEVTLKGAVWISEITGKENPTITKEFWVQAFDLVCVMSDEEKDKHFKKYILLCGELMMEAFSDIIAKYKANGVCRTFGQNPEPGGLDNFESSPIG